MKKFLAFVLCCAPAIMANHADAQYPIYEAPAITYSAPVYSTISVPMSTYAMPVQTYSTPTYGMYSVPVVAPAPPVGNYPTYFQPATPGIFGRIIDLERRKNAWLRQTFLGRP